LAPLLLLLLLLRGSLAVPSSSPSTATTTLMDAAGNLRLADVHPTVAAAAAGVVVALVTSPGTPSFFSQASAAAAGRGREDDSAVLSLSSGGGGDPPLLLICRGATLAGGTTGDDAGRGAIMACSLLAGAVVLDGVTGPDLLRTGGGGLRNSRHARTCAALFRARCRGGPDAGATTRQALFVACAHHPPADDEGAVRADVEALYEAAAAEVAPGTCPAFDEAYDLQVVRVSSPEEASKVRMCPKQEYAAAGSSENTFPSRSFAPISSYVCSSSL
jgi:hypothetical protein